jgi:hypothetical protein
VSRVRWRGSARRASCCGKRASGFAPLRRLRPLGAAARAPDALARATRRFVDAARLSASSCVRSSCASSTGWSRGRTSRLTAFMPRRTRPLASLRASLALAPAAEAEAGDDAKPGDAPEPDDQLALGEQPGGQAGAGDGDERPLLALAEPRSGPTPKRRSSNRTSVSATTRSRSTDQAAAPQSAFLDRPFDPGGSSNGFLCRRLPCLTWRSALAIRYQSSC